MKNGKMSYIGGMLIFLAVLLIILGVFVMPLFPWTQDIWKQFFGADGNDKNATSVKIEVGSMPLIAKKLEGTRGEVREKIAQEVYACWNRMMRSELQKEKCNIIIFNPVTPVFPRKELVEAVMGRDTEAGEAFNEVWGYGDETGRGNELPGNRPYLVCADYNDNIWPLPNTAYVYLTNNLGFSCGR